MKDTSIDSGERHVHLDLNFIPSDHLIRYEYASNVIANNHNNGFGCEVFCGTGYGAYLISQKTSAKIFAIDGSEESINAACKTYLSANLFYMQKFFPFNLPKAAFDFVVSMESLEHVKDYNIFLRVVSESIKPGGDLFLSMPNQDVMPLDPEYKWHFKHFYSDEAHKLFSENSLSIVESFSTLGSTLNKRRQVEKYYPYQVDNHKLFGESFGDTFFYHLKRL